MTDRLKITDAMRKYLEDRLNCKNVMAYIDKKMLEKINGTNQKHKLRINSIPVTVEIIKYNDSDTGTEMYNKKWVEEQIKIYDFITEANYTGFEYFPYLYGVLNCHNEENSKLYLFYEYFEGNLLNLINKLEHPSEWYDIVFQLIIINYYMETIHKYQYNGEISNHLYNKLSKPIYQLYQFDNYQFNINHKYLIALWNIDKLEKITDSNSIKRNTDILLKYLVENKDNFKIPPSGRIIKLLSDIQDSPENTLLILDQYYNVKIPPK